MDSTTTAGALELDERDGHPLGVVARNGFWEDDFAVTATLTNGRTGGIAFRIQDKNNYFLVTPYASYNVLWKVVDGAFSLAGPPVIVYDNWSLPHDWYVRTSGDDVDIAVKIGGVWTTVYDSAGNGAGLLAGGPAEGAVGLATLGIVTAQPLVCDAFAFGYDPAGSGSITQVIGSDTFEAGDLAIEPAYDAAGNMVNDGMYVYSYDAWNRLVAVRRDAASAGSPYDDLATYAYDGLGRRISKAVTNSGSRDRTEYFYYNANWQLLQIDSGSGQATRQFVWGATYIDEAICMDVDTDGDGECTDFDGTPAGARRYHYMQDANWNVIGLREGTTVVERYEYDPYGTCRVYRTWDAAAGQEDMTVAGDSPAGNPIRYAGYFHDNETDLYNVRHRMYSPSLGRWMQRDPAGYVDGMNTYAYLGSAPIEYTDPRGLWKPQKHRSLTDDSLHGWLEVANPCPNSECSLRMNSRLQEANVSQDALSMFGGGFGDSRRHYTRDVGVGVATAKAQYAAYLASEMSIWNAGLSAASNASSSSSRRAACREALDAMGRLSHSWQDYYAHAVLVKTSKPAPAWTAEPQIKGTPYNNNANLKPASYSLRPWMRPEHPSFWEPLDNGSSEQLLRLRDAEDFATKMYTQYLPQWYSICECECWLI